MKHKTKQQNTTFYLGKGEEERKTKQHNQKNPINKKPQTDNSDNHG